MAYVGVSANLMLDSNILCDDFVVIATCLTEALGICRVLFSIAGADFTMISIHAMIC